MLFCSIFEDHGRFNRQCHNRMAVRKYRWDDKSRFLPVEERKDKKDYAISFCKYSMVQKNPNNLKATYQSCGNYVRLFGPNFGG